MKKDIIFDLDGTLADVEHRLHFIKDEDPPKWEKFFKACTEDAVIFEMERLYNHFAGLKDHRVRIWTGRSDMVEEETRQWLKDHGLNGYYELRMRKEGDHRPDYKIKKEWLEDIGYGRAKLIFEDRQQVIDMWQENHEVVIPVKHGSIKT